MRGSKRGAVRWAAFVIAGFLVLGTFYRMECRENEALRRQVAVSYDHAFSELTTAMGKLDTVLRKASYATSPGLVSSLCAEAYAEALEAQMALGALPYANVELPETASFITRTGDYVYFLSKNAASGAAVSPEERENLRKLERSAAAVTETLEDLYARLLTGGVSLEELDRAETEISQEEDALLGDEGFSGGFKRLESEFPEMPTLIYDGPFSDHIHETSPKRLAGEPDITAEEALRHAAVFLGQDRKRLTLAGERAGEVPVYIVTRQNGADTATVEVTRQGGRILWYGTSRFAGEPVISAEDCVKIAENFMERQGFRAMTVTYWEVESGDVVVNFAHEQEGVLCYPDLIKVSVAMDTGAVSGYEALGYLTNHEMRSLPRPAVSAEAAQGRLASGLIVENTRLAVIPTSGRYEVLCHEFLCRDEDGSRSLIYVNAATGAEEKILLLLEDENGTLTI